jgi:glutaconate CoA-transferase subunit A
MVDAVVEVPYGAHPTSFFPNYGYDSRFHRKWTALSRDADEAAAFLERHIRAPSSQQEYLEAAGGVAVLERIEKWEERA